jgi:carbamoyltransferase
MGLAPYGTPRYADEILDKLLDLKDDGSFRLDLSYFNYCQGLTMTSKKFDDLFDGPPRTPESPLTQREMDLAASIQKVTEETVLRAVRHLHARTGMKNLCLAGGVALNCVGNGRILREGPFERIWIQPAAGDAGGALGTALFIWHQLLGNGRRVQVPDGQTGSLLGPSYSEEEIKVFLDGTGAVYRHIEDDSELDREIVDLIEQERVVGLLQGRMEFGPRALGCRSIIGDARSRDMQSVMNLKIKFRESFRPFAPIVLRERVSDYFEMEDEADSPYMLLVADVAEDKRLAVPDEGVTGLDKLKVSRSGGAGDHPRRQLGTGPDGRSGAARAAPPADAVLRGAHRVSGDDQHLVQRPWRAHRLHAGARIPLFHGHRHGRVGAGELLAPQGGAAADRSAGPRRLPGSIRARLRECR